MTSLDAIILGWGPAGLSAALRLHSLGHRVALLGTDTTRTHCPLETVPLIEVITHAFPGLDLDGSSIIDTRRVGVSHWTGEPQPTPAVCVVQRGSATTPGLDHALRRHVAQAGVPMHPTGKSALSLTLGERCQVRAGDLHLTSRFVINATGRHSPFRSRSGLTLWRQVVITGQMSLPGDVPSLWTESLPDGWLWAIRDRGDQWLVSLFTDPEYVKPDTEATWRRMLQNSRLGSRVHIGKTTQLNVQETSPVAASSAFDRNLVHIGDAVLARCPLASQGLSAAISDGQSAATAVSSLLRDLASEATITCFLETRLQQARVRHEKFLATSYASTGLDTPYWRQRGDQVMPSETLPEPSPQLDSPLALSPAWTLREHPTLTDDRIQLAPCLCSEDETLRWFAGHAIAELLSPVVTCTHTTVRTLVQSWRTNNCVSDSTAKQLLRWLHERRVLVKAASARTQELIPRSSGGRSN